MRATWLRFPRRTARIRLTALYGGLFLLSGAALVATTYALFLQATRYRTPLIPKVPRAPAIGTLQPLVPGPAGLSYQLGQVQKGLARTQNQLTLLGEPKPGGLITQGQQLTRDQHQLTQDQHQLAGSLQQLAQSVHQLTEAGVDRLFQPFQRLDRHRAAYQDGHGLGLSIVRAISTAHHASITARPGPDGGLSVSVTFPPPASGDAGRAGQAGTPLVTRRGG